MYNETQKDDGARGNAPHSEHSEHPEQSEQSDGGVIVCVDAAEARLMRDRGHICITAAKLRSQLVEMIGAGGEFAVNAAAEAVQLLGSVSETVDPEGWSIWKFPAMKCAGRVRQALADLLVVSTPFLDPQNHIELGARQPWTCTGTTLLVAKDTRQAVQAADTYAKSNPYRHHGRMDEPFTPQSGRVCIVTIDELRLVRIAGLEDIILVSTYEPEKMAGDNNATCWPTAIRVLCAERPDLRVVTAPALLAPRVGNPFFLGLVRGTGYETSAVTNPTGRAALRFAIETNIQPRQLGYTVVVWEGGDDVRELVRYGGLRIFVDGEGRDGKRRKVQLRSLGLIRADTVAGASIYDMDANRAILEAWAARRDFAKKRVTDRDHNRQRVRYKALPEYHQGAIYNTLCPPHGIRVTLGTKRKAATMLRKMFIAELVGGGGVTTVRLKDLREGHTYCLNARATVKGDEVLLDGRRCMIRSMRWKPDDASALLAWLAKSPHVVASGVEPAGTVFAVVRVANGTIDQQEEAVQRWAEDIGRRFPQAMGCCSWMPNCMKVLSTVTVGSLHHVNWKAESLATAHFAPYKLDGDFGKSTETVRRGTSSALQRAQAYANKVEGLDTVGTRNTALSSAMLNIRDKFGLAALEEVAPKLMARCTLPDKEKRIMLGRISAGDGK